MVTINLGIVFNSRTSPRQADDSGWSKHQICRDQVKNIYRKYSMASSNNVWVVDFLRLCRPVQTTHLAHSTSRLVGILLRVAFIYLYLSLRRPARFQGLPTLRHVPHWSSGQSRLDPSPKAATCRFVSFSMLEFLTQYSAPISSEFMSPTSLADPTSSANLPKPAKCSSALAIGLRLPCSCEHRPPWSASVPRWFYAIVLHTPCQFSERPWRYVAFPRS